MKSYYIHDGQNQKGPMSLEELLKSGIHSDTQVWHSELESWTAAKNLEELKLLFMQRTPPPFVTSSTIPGANIAEPMSAKKKNSGRFFFRILLLLLVLLGIAFVLFIVTNRNQGGSGSTATYNESKMSVGDYERTHPNEFLDATGTYNETLFGNKMKIRGTVKNRATVANFKDIVIEVKYYSSTKTHIKTERLVLYQFVPAHSTKTFEWKITPPGGTESMDWDAVGGMPYY